MRFSHDELVRCVRREVMSRKRYYPQWIGNDKIRKEEACIEIELMQAVGRYLEGDDRMTGDLRFCEAPRCVNQFREGEGFPAYSDEWPAPEITICQACAEKPPVGVSRPSIIPRVTWVALTDRTLSCQRCEERHTMLARDLESAITRIDRIRTFENLHRSCSAHPAGETK